MKTSVRVTLMLFNLIFVMLVSAQSTEQWVMTEVTLVDDLARKLDEMAVADEFSGTVMLAHDGDIIFGGMYGYANREAQILNEMDTLFNLGSMNKMFTSVSIAQLVEQGLLEFDAPIGLYLDDIPTDIAETITIHHLLTHTSGLADYFMSPQWADYVEETDTVRGYFPLFINESLHFTAGEQFEYSNSNFTVLGAIIEAVTGEDYFDYVREHIYQPVGMQLADTYTSDSLPANAATGYTIFTPEGRPGNTINPNTSFLPANGSPAGGGYGSAPELIAFADALFNGSLLDVELVDMITTPKIDVPIPGLNMRYAYGFEIKASNSIGHSGGFPGVSSAIGIFPEAGYTYVVLSNTDMGGRTIMMYLEEQFNQLPNQEVSNN